MDATDQLAEIQLRANTAAEGPWTVESGVSPEGGHVHDVAAPPEPSGMRFDFLPILATGCTSDDAEFIAHARTDVPRLVAALRAVLDLHTETYYDGPRCTECASLDGVDPAPEFYPCPTVRAVEDALSQ